MNYPAGDVAQHEQTDRQAEVPIFVRESSDLSLFVSTMGLTILHHLLDRFRICGSFGL